MLWLLSSWLIMKSSDNWFSIICCRFKSFDLLFTTYLIFQSILSISAVREFPRSRTDFRRLLRTWIRFDRSSLHLSSFSVSENSKCYQGNQRCSLSVKNWLMRAFYLMKCAHFTKTIFAFINLDRIQRQWRFFTLTSCISLIYRVREHVGKSSTDFY